MPVKERGRSADGSSFSLRVGPQPLAPLWVGTSPLAAEAEEQDTKVTPISGEDTAKTSYTLK